MLLQQTSVRGIKQSFRTRLCGASSVPPTAAECRKVTVRPNGKRVANDQEGQIRCSNLASHLLLLVGDTGIEPVTSTVPHIEHQSRYRRWPGCPRGRRPACWRKWPTWMALVLTVAAGMSSQVPCSATMRHGSAPSTGCCCTPPVPRALTRPACLTSWAWRTAASLPCPARRTRYLRA